MNYKADCKESESLATISKTYIMKATWISALAISFIAVLLILRNQSAAKAQPESTDKSNEGIVFETTAWSDVLAKASKEQKLVFIDAYASWCGPCKLLKWRTFPDATAGKYFNEHFVNVAFDMEKGEGPSIAKKFGVRAYPTLIITDATGNIVARTEGYMDAASLISFGEYALQKYNKN